MHRIKIAFADNHDYIIKMTKYYLSHSDEINLFITAKDGISLIEQIAANTILPDVCLIDINMPRMNGFSTIKHIKSQWPDIKLIAFTGHQKSAYLEELILQGIHSFLRKDIHPKELIRAIKEVHLNGKYYSGDFNIQTVRNMQNNPPPFHRLAEMERRVLNHIVNGKTYNEISATLHLSIGSVESQRRNIFQTLNINKKVDLVSFIIHNGYEVILQSYE